MGLLSFFYYIAYRGKILCVQLLLHPLIDLFIPIHSDQHNMEMTRKTGFCDAASFA